MAGEIIKPDYPELNVDALANVYGTMRESVVKQADLDRQKKDLVDLIMEDVVKTTSKLLEVSEMALKHITDEKFEIKKAYNNHLFLDSADFNVSRGRILIRPYYFFVDETGVRNMGTRFKLKIIPSAWRKATRVKATNEAYYLSPSYYSYLKFFSRRAEEYAYKGYSDNLKRLFEVYHLMPEILANAVVDITGIQQKEQENLSEHIKVVEERVE